MNGKRYTVQDTKSGKSVTFEWNHTSEPTDADFEDVFNAAGLRDATQQPTFQSQPDHMTLSRMAQNIGVGMQHPLQALAVGAANALPPIGAMVGSLAGPIGTAGGTMAGELLNQDVRDMVGMEHSSPMDKIKQAALSGGLAGGLDGVMGVAGKILNPERMYAAALKPSTALSPEVRASIINKGLTDGTGVSVKGYEKSAAEIKDIANRTNQQIADETTQGTKYDLPMIIEPQMAALRSTAPVQPDRVGYGNAVDNFESTFLNRPNPLSPDDLMRLKRNTGKELQPYFQNANQNVPTAERTTDAIKSKAYFGIRDYLEQRFPELAGLNENSSEKILLHDAIARATNRINNRELVGLPELGSATATAAASENPLTAAAAFVAHKVLMNPAVMSRIAIALHAARPVGQMAQFAFPPLSSMAPDALRTQR